MPHGPGYRDPRRVNRAARNRARAACLARDTPCAICGGPIDMTIPWPDPWSAEVDEIIPVSRGGSPTDARNLEKVHRRCNQLKGDGTLEAARLKAEGRPSTDWTRVRFESSQW